MSSYFFQPQLVGSSEFRQPHSWAWVHLFQNPVKGLPCSLVNVFVFVILFEIYLKNRIDHQDLGIVDFKAYAEPPGPRGDGSNKIYNATIIACEYGIRHPICWYDDWNDH